VSAIGPAGSPGETPARERRGALLVAVLFAAVSAALVVRNLSLFRKPIFEWGDQAANSILVDQAVHFRLLVGNYSRLHFNHPGPAFLYIQAAGQQLFYALLHAVPAPYNGQVLAVIALNAVLIALSGLVVCRRLGSATLGAGFVLVCLLVTRDRLLWTSTWMPYLYAAPFLLAVLAGSSLAAGNLSELPLYVLAVGLLVHGHVAFIPIMGLYTLLVATCLFVQLRRSHDPARDLVRRHRGALCASALLAIIFLLPIVLELVLHWPGPWALYWRYARSNPRAHPHSLAAALRYVLGYWSHDAIERILFAGAAIAGVVLVATDQDTTRRRFILGLNASSAVLSLFFLAYVMLGVDRLDAVDTYVGFFYYVIPAVVVATAAVSGAVRVGAIAAAGRARTAHPGNGRAWHPTRARAARAAALLALAPIVAGASAGLLVLGGRSFVDGSAGDSGLPRVSATVAAARPRGTTTVVVQLPTSAPGRYGWPDVTGLIVMASRQGYYVCVSKAFWAFMMTPAHICEEPDDEGALWIMALPAGEPVAAGWTEVARDAFMTVARRAPAARPAAPREDQMGRTNGRSDRLPSLA
jgi:hypothetical protein